MRQLSRVALDRLCQRVIEEIDRIGSDSARSYHQRYLDIFEAIQDRDKEIAQTFDGLRRSTALFQLAAIRAKDLLTEDEYQGFSEETRSTIEFLLRG